MSQIRNLFVGVGVGAVILIALFGITSVVLAELERDTQWKKEHAERLEHEDRMRIEDMQRNQKDAIEVAQKKAQAKERELALKTQAAELEKARRLRSAKEATDAAAKDFL